MGLGDLARVDPAVAIATVEAIAVLAAVGRVATAIAAAAVRAAAVLVPGADAGSARPTR